MPHHLFPLSLVIFFDLWIVMALTVYYGFVSRWHGGGFFSAPKIVKNIAWGLPMGFISGWLYLNYRIPSLDLIYRLSVAFGPNFQLYRHALWLVPLVVFVLVTGLSALCKATGHGAGIDMGTSKTEPGNGREPEFLEFLVLWMNGRLTPYWYDFVFMSVVGIFSTLAAALAVGWVYAPAGMVIALGGALKGLSYRQGWKKFPQGSGPGPCDFRDATQIAEWHTGLCAGAAMGFAFIILKVWIFAHS